MVEEARRLRERGIGWADIGLRLNARPASIRQWMKQTTPPLLPVTVERSATPERSNGRVIVTPEGFRVEGLDLESAHEFLESLRC